MILEQGSQVLVAHRRLFSGDHGRYFAGVVEAYENGIARITGHTWIRDGYRGSYTRKADARTKIISLASGSVIVYQLPSSVDLSNLRLFIEGSTVMLRDRAASRWT